MKKIILLSLISTFMYSQNCHEPTGWCYDLSTEVAYYMFETVRVGGELAIPCGGYNGGGCDDAINDVIGAFCNNTMVGFDYILSSFTTIPTHGNTIENHFPGYCEYGDVPQFKYYDASNNIIINIYNNNLSPSTHGDGTVEAFINNNINIVGDLYINMTECNNDLGVGFIDNCGICSGGNTGLIPDADMDCTGLCFGNAFENECGCVGGSTGYNEYYCYGCTNSCSANYEEFYTIDDESCDGSNLIINYNLIHTNNLVGYSRQSQSISSAIPDQFESYIIKIIGEGVAATQIQTGVWVGSLTTLKPGDGLWIEVSEPIENFYFE